MSITFIEPRYSNTSNDKVILPPTPSTSPTNTSQIRNYNQIPDTNLPFPFQRRRLSFETVSIGCGDDNLPHIIRSQSNVRYVSVSARHGDYHLFESTRVLMFAFSEDMECSYNSFKWLQWFMMTDGDDILCIKHISNKQLRGNLITTECLYQYAKDILSDILSIKGKNPKINISVEILVGDANSVVEHSLDTYEPDLVIMPANSTNRTRYSKSRDDILTYLEYNCHVSLMKIFPNMIQDIQSIWQSSGHPTAKLSFADVDNLPRRSNSITGYEGSVPFRSSLNRLLGSMAVRGRSHSLSNW